MHTSINIGTVFMIVHLHFTAASKTDCGVGITGGLRGGKQEMAAPEFV